MQHILYIWQQCNNYWLYNMYWSNILDYIEAYYNIAPITLNQYIIGPY
jgi:hypothetical protein